MQATSLAAVWQSLGWDPVATDVLVTGVTSDSRQVVAGDLFIACVGDPQRLHSFIAEAQSKQAAVVAIDETQLQLVATSNFTVPIVAVKQLAQQQGKLAARVLGESSAKLLLTGITGTNGKTSISHYVAQACSNLGRTCGVIGTTGNGLLKHLVPGPNTTPDAVSVQAILAQMQAQGAQACAMEVSSHGLHQGRVSGCQFHIAVLSNLSRDHLDYHGSMQAYAQAKAMLFSWPGLQHAVINIDDEFGKVLVEQMAADVQLWTYTTRRTTPEAVISASAVRYTSRGLVAKVTTPLGQLELATGLYGEFNLSNLLATIGVLLAMDYSLADMQYALNTLHAVAGRMEKYAAATGLTVIVDYAHTPDALQAALQATRQHLHTGQLWCVFGCGGDRDQGKRPLMAQVAEQWADQIVVTDDNPRFEDSAAIIQQIQAGFTNLDKVKVISDRKGALDFALHKAQPGDIVLVAGKGHEDYQEIAGQRQAFSDRTQVANLLQELAP
ncbi:MAG: UDP-N-acetylmuramoyl-L-alanyl-D-glutamate--2,6-diaminopimelate ligase [Gammaproteobacteria bacterium]|nr:UDP-N-acetylmuramoyl-L-alanyl-D-glutamate--2,6-diaminopimelate ligase [Gammaproteobacteria bacterium]